MYFWGAIIDEKNDVHDTNLWLQEKLNDLEKTKHRLGIDEHNDIDATRHFIR